MTQNERVLQYMQEHSGISTLDAFRDLGCTRLPGEYTTYAGVDMISMVNTQRVKTGLVCRYGS